MGEKHLKLSRFLSFLLRHEPEKIGLTLDPQGYLLVDELLSAMNNSGATIDKTILDEIIESDNKQRYSYDVTGTKIRANQGHSVKVDLGLLESTPQGNLYHGTSERFLDSIMEKGLNRMKREWVHLSSNREVAIEVGSRHGKPVVLEVDTENMIKDGFKFYISENKVWLTESVPTKYLKGATIT